MDTAGSPPDERAASARHRHLHRVRPSTVAPVLIAAHKARSRAALRALLDAHPAFDVCADVADASSAVDEAMRLRPSLCLLEVRMPGNGIAAAWEIAARLPRTRIVMLADSEDERDLFRALRAGATGYLVKGRDSRRLATTLLAVLEGEAAIPRTLVARVVAEFRDRGPRRRRLEDDAGRHLTSREWEVLELLREGRTTAEIARLLDISEATARSHIASALRKLGTATRDEAVRLLSDTPRA